MSPAEPSAGLGEPASAPRGAAGAGAAIHSGGGGGTGDSAVPSLALSPLPSGGGLGGSSCMGVTTRRGSSNRSGKGKRRGKETSRNW